MDITQTKTPPAQQNVGLKLVKAESQSPVQPPSSSPSVAPNSEDNPKESKAEITENITQQVSKMNEYVQSIQRDLNFSVDDSSGEVVVKVFDRETDELIRQFPTEEALKLAERMKENSEGGSGLILKVEV